RVHWRMRSAVILAVFVVGVGLPATALAQRFSFEKTYSVTDPLVLDVVTERGKIEVVAGEPGRVVVAGAATVRIGWKVPANAPDLARHVAENPPIELIAGTV